MPLKSQTRPKPPSRGCRALCCTCRHSISSSDEPESSVDAVSDRHPTVSSIAHAMVQERLDGMIRERREERRKERRRRGGGGGFVVVVATEKFSGDPREDFRESMAEMIAANGISEARDLRRLLNCYVAVNREEHRGVILEVFYEVCSDIFL